MNKFFISILFSMCTIILHAADGTMIRPGQLLLYSATMAPTG